MESFDNVEKIYFLKKDNFGTRYMYELNIKGCKESFMDTIESKVYEIDKAEAELKGKDLYGIIKDWNPEYVDSNVIDGIEYTFVIEYNTGERFSVYCKNKFPQNVREFLDRIREY